MAWHALCLCTYTTQHAEATIFGQMLVSLLGDEQLPADLDSEDPIKLLGRDLADVTKALQAGIGDDDIDVLEMRESLIEQHFDFLGIAHIGFDGNGVLLVFCLDLLNQLLRSIASPVIIDHHGATLAGDFERVVSTHTSARSGDEGDFAIEAGGGWSRHVGRMCRSF